MANGQSELLSRCLVSRKQSNTKINWFFYIYLFGVCSSLAPADRTLKIIIYDFFVFVLGSMKSSLLE